MEKKIEVGVLGATGMVGQHFVKFLQNHPWFNLTWVGASDRSAGKKYAEATSWRLDGAMPAGVAALDVQECKPGNAPKLVFSATDASVATEIEQAFASAGHVVVSNSRNHRMDQDVPLLIPEINGEHLKLISRQRKERGWPGQIVTNPNCSTIVLAMALAPMKQFGIERVVVATMQAISGAGYPGVASMDINANVIPFIGGEEEKMEQETQKILGDFLAGVKPARGQSQRPLQSRSRSGWTHGGRLGGIQEQADSRGSAQRRRNVHRPAAAAQSAQRAARPLIYMEQQDRPQPRRDAGRENGMAVFVGRLRECPVFDFKFLACGHNTIRGAAGAAVLNAELMQSEGLLD